MTKNALVHVFFLIHSLHTQTKLNLTKQKPGLDAFYAIRREMHQACSTAAADHTGLTTSRANIVNIHHKVYMSNKC